MWRVGRGTVGRRGTVVTRQWGAWLLVGQPGGQLMSKCFSCCLQAVPEVDRAEQCLLGAPGFRISPKLESYSGKNYWWQGVEHSKLWLRDRGVSVLWGYLRVILADSWTVKYTVILFLWIYAVWFMSVKDVFLKNIQIAHWCLKHIHGEFLPKQSWFTPSNAPRRNNSQLIDVKIFNKLYLSLL